LCRHHRCRHNASQSRDRADRKIDAGTDDHQRHADRDDGVDRRLQRDRGEIRDGQELMVEQREHAVHDDEAEHDAQTPHALDRLRAPRPRRRVRYR
jgi:hypothetical protein